MQERIVYFLGAGFSAPLGLPVMSNFLAKSKDLFFSNPERFSHFEKVFQLLDSMAKAKNYYSFDLFNLEEVLSILEMEDYVGSSTHRELYLQYLRDVISELTPNFTPTDESGWEPRLFSPEEKISDYATFVATLWGLEWARPLVRGVPLTGSKKEIGPKYSVITLNYDLIIEKSLELVALKTRAMEPLFASTLEEKDAGLFPLAKLHGSIKPLTIIPPTWNKVGNAAVRDSWRLAYRLLADANQIRFLGYSLPLTDTYVRYLLGSAILESKHLKQIDVLCRDDERMVVQNRYSSLLTFPNFRFRNGDIRDFLREVRRFAEQHTERLHGDFITRIFDGIEPAHANIFTQGGAA